MEDRKMAFPGFPFFTAHDLGQGIRAERKARGWTQADLAQKAGCQRQTVVALESGQNVGTHILMAVLRALNKGLRIEAAGRIEYERLQAIFAEDGDED